MAAPPQKLRWGELEEEDDGGDLDFLLSPPVVLGPDENGVKKTIQYRFDDEGNKVKVTTTTRVRKLARARLSKRALERCSWAKFGDAVHEDVGSRLTMVSTEEILLERPRAPGSKAEETNIAGDALAAAGKAGAVLMVCRTCGKKGDHWTSKCPYKDLAPQTDNFIDKALGPETAASASGTNKGTYVPPGMRGGDRSGVEMKRRDENSVRVTNLSEDTREPDLLELFRAFGPVSRVYVAVDQKLESVVALVSSISFTGKMLKELSTNSMDMVMIIIFSELSGLPRGQIEVPFRVDDSSSEVDLPFFHL